MESKQRKIGVILSYVSIVCNTLVTLIYMPIMLRMMGQSEYGLYSLVSSIISYLTILDLGFGNAIIVYISKYRAKNKKEEEYRLNGMFLIIYTIIGMIAGLIGVGLYVNAGNIFGNSMTMQEVGKAQTMMLILIINLVVTFPLTIFKSIITAYERFIFPKVVNILRIILMPCIMIPLLLMGYQSVAMAVVTTVLNITVLFINVWYCFRNLKVHFIFTHFSMPLLKEVFQYSIFVALTIIIDKINWNTDQFILGAVAGTVAVAVYAIGALFSNSYQSFSTAISGVMLPKLAKMVENGQSDEAISDEFIKTGRIQYQILGLVMTGFLIFGQSFIRIWAGDGYQDAYLIACILMLPFTVCLIQNVGISILQAKNKHRFRTLVYLGISIANVAISIPLAKAYGGIGSAIGTAISLIVGDLIIMNIYYSKVIHIAIGKFWREIGKISIGIVIAMGIGVGSCYLIQPNHIVTLAINVLIYVVIYITILGKWAANSYEKDLVKQILKSKKRFLEN